MVTFQQIEDAEFEVGQLRSKFLSQHGWVQTCQVPGSYWVWVRTFNGQQLMADTVVAVGMQRTINAREMQE